MKAFLGRLAAFLRARWAEPSTHAGLAAFLLAAAGTMAATGDGQGGIVPLLVAAAYSGLKAAMTADPQLAGGVVHTIAIGSVAAPALATIAEDILPQHAARIAAIEQQLQLLAPRLQPGA